MRNMTRGPNTCLRVVLTMLFVGMVCATAYGDLTLLGVQYQEDEYNSDFFCYWDVWDWPTSCKTSGDFPPGATAFVYYKNTGETNITLSDVELEDYSLPTVLYERVSGINVFHSIWFYWDHPPQAILDAGEPIFYRCEPKDAATLYPGDVGCCAVRLRWVPTTNPIDIDIETSANTVTGTVSIDNTQPRVANVSFTTDRKTVYIHWRRPENTAPATIKIDGTDVTSDSTTVNDTDYDFCVTKIELDTALSDMSLHVYEGIWSDGEKAFAGVRTYANQFVYGTYGADDVASSLESKAFINTCEDRNVNAIVHTMGSDLVAFLTTTYGQEYAAAHNYGGIIDDPHQWGFDPPVQWYLREEPECRDANLGCNDNNLNIPCDYDGYLQLGALSLSSVEHAHQRRNHNNVPTMTCIDGWKKPHNYHVYGQVQDMAWADPYYQPRLKNVYWYYNDRIGLFENAKWIYATSRTLAAGAEPYPSGITLYSNEYHEPDTTLVWPYADQECKRIEVYYTLAGGAKGMSYWWFRGYPNGSSWGLMRHDEVQRCGELWDEIGLCGNEIRAAQPLLVTSHPVDDLTITGSTDVWVKGLACGIDSLLLIAVNDDYYVDSNGDTQISDVSNATVTVTLPTWMQSPTPSAFTIHRHGCKQLSSSIDGEDMTITIGTLDVARIIVVTTDSTKFTTYKNRFLDECMDGICTFSSGDCLVPYFTAQPESVSIAYGGTATFAATAGGAATITYQWQLDGSDLSNGGHYSGVTTATLTVSNAGAADAGDYTCDIANSYDDATSQAATLTLTCGDAIHILNGDFDDGFTDGLAESWLTYQAAGFIATWSSGAGNPSPGQRCDYNATRSTRWFGIRQSFPTIVGDACTFTADVWCISNSNNVNCSLRVDWDGGTQITAASQVCNADQDKQTWTQLGYGSGQATNTTTGLFADVRGMSDSNADGDTYWDNITVYHMHKPQAPTVEQVSTSSSSLDVTIVEGCNYDNSSAQYKITIGGGAYTLETNWVQSDGTVGTSAVWQTASTWGTKRVTGLAADTEYTFKVVGRYSSTYTQETTISDGASSECATLLVITDQPDGMVLCDGETASFTVAATGEGTLSYQWQFDQSDLSNGGVISGVTTTTLMISVFDGDTMEGAYRCVVTDDNMSVASEEAGLIEGDTVTITQHPMNTGACLGETAVFYIYDTSGDEKKYRWYIGETKLNEGSPFHYTGTRTQTLFIHDMDSTITGDYKCEVSNDCATAFTNTATLSLYSDTSISAHPSAQDICEGQSATFSVTASGSNLYYQWQKTQSDLSNGGDLSGVTTATLTIANVEDADAGNYRCKVSGSCGTVNSNEAALTTKDATTITDQPDADSMCVGATATFTVAATGEGTLSYQWQKTQSDLSNGGSISGVTTTTLTITNVQTSDAANYRCVVTSSGCGAANSDEAALTVTANTNVTADPDNEMLLAGATATFTVTAEGGSLTYQWQKAQSDLSNGGDISGVTTATLTIQNVDSSDEANYRCVVNGSCGGSDTSAEASLTIDVCGWTLGLENGDFDDGFSGTSPAQLGNGWTSYNVGGATATFKSGNGNPSPGQRADYDKTRDTRYYGFRQSFDANSGDAFTFTADVWCQSNYFYTICDLRADWAGGTAALSSTQLCTAGQAKQEWTSLPYGSGNATSDSVTLFVDVRGTTDSNSDSDSYWDNIISYRAFVPDAPEATSASSTSLNVNVDPGCNSLNSDAQFAITISGGGYSEGTHWVQANGSITTSVVWQTDASWGTVEITGLTTDTQYTLKAKARYSSSLTQNTSLSSGGTGTPVSTVEFTDQPDADTVCSGGTATFTVGATGVGTVTYQWQKDSSNLSNGGDISGVTTTTLTIVNVEAGDAGNYRCVVTDDSGPANSDQAALTVASDPTITDQPDAQDLCPGSTAQFTVAASGGLGTLTYQWQKDSSDLANGGDISGATATTLSIANIEAGDAGDYRCVVSDNCTSVNSNTAALSLQDGTTITDHPDADSVCVGGTATFTVAATGEGTLTYQWQKDQSDLANGGDISGATTATLTIVNAEAADEADYRCVVGGSCGSEASNEASLTVLTNTAISAHPSADSVCEGGTATFSVTGSGSNLTYQWQKAQSDLSNGGDISGVTTDTLMIVNVESGDAANYRCVVSGDCGSANSNEAALTVQTATSITAQPDNTLVDEGGTATFSVTATGQGTVSYQWQKDQSDLSNGGDISGVTTSTLTITNADSADEADYRCVVTATCGSVNSDEKSLAVNDCDPGTELDNGDFADFTGGIADNFTSYAVGGATPTFVSGGGNPYPGQRGDYTKTRLTRFYGVRQLVDATAGDAFTFSADVYCISHWWYATCALRTDWAGGTTPAESSQICDADQEAKTWTSLPYASGNATSTQLMIFLDVRGTTDSNSDTDTYWDNLVAYRAHIPPAPIVNEASSTSLYVDVNPGCNDGNSSAQYAITIDGGAYTEGTHWVQSDGTVSTSTVWQTDSTWGNEEVTGLSTSTTYTFKTKARYSSTYTEDTTLGSGASGTP